MIIGTCVGNTEGSGAARVLKIEEAGRVGSTGWVNYRQALASLPRQAGRFGAAHSSSLMEPGANRCWQARLALRLYFHGYQ
jgi:hypothetical protein